MVLAREMILDTPEMILDLGEKKMFKLEKLFCEFVYTFYIL